MRDNADGGGCTVSVASTHLLLRSAAVGIKGQSLFHGALGVGEATQTSICASGTKVVLSECDHAPGGAGRFELRG